MSERRIFHIDVNSAFLSWEAARRVKNGESDLREIASVVGGKPTSRTGIVVAKSILAKSYGINTGEPIGMALRKCPDLVCVPPDFELYVKCSKEFKSICQEYTPVMESYSIDEVFLDMSGMKNIFPDLVATANEIKDRIKNELGFTVNVGIGENKVCAKMASDFEKPDKVHTLYLNEISKKMWPLPIGDLFTCGKASARKLSLSGIKTIGDLAQCDIKEITLLLGDKQGNHLYNYANGYDEDPVAEQREEAKGFSAETTVDENLESFEAINHMLLAQADVVAARMRAENARCRCIGVTFRTTDFINKSHQRKLDDYTNITEIIYETAKQLVKESWRGEALRLIGLSLSDIDREGCEQISLFENDKQLRLQKLDSAMDSIRNRFGTESIKRASTVDVGKRINRKYKAELESKN